MIIISMDDFQRCADLAGRVGKWEAWSQTYFPKYEAVFSAMLKNLYQCSITDLEDAVENLDFDHALNTAREFFKADGLSAVENLLAKSEEMCAFAEEFDLYLLIGLGHVDGTSLPGEKPFLYFGLECYTSNDHLAYLVPHEYNHMVRLWSVYHGNFDGLGFGEMVITEGLAVVFSSMVVKNESPNQAESALFMTEDDLRFCLKHRDALIPEVLDHWQEPYEKDLMSRYMMGSIEWKDGRPTRIGYFVGAEIVKAVLAKGIDICALTRMPTAEIMNLFHAIQAG